MHHPDILEFIFIFKQLKDVLVEVQTVFIMSLLHIVSEHAEPDESLELIANFGPAKTAV